MVSAFRRDIERRAAMYGVAAKIPAPYPAKQSVLANLIAIVGMREGWGRDFVGAAYRRRGDESRAGGRDRCGKGTRYLWVADIHHGPRTILGRRPTR